MNAERRSPRQWARDILSPNRMITIVGLRIMKDMIGVSRIHIFNPP